MGTRAWAWTWLVVASLCFMAAIWLLIVKLAEPGSVWTGATKEPTTQERARAWNAARDAEWTARKKGIDSCAKGCLPYGFSYGPSPTAWAKDACTCRSDAPK